MLPRLLVSTSLQASKHIGQIGDLMFVCHFCIFSSVYIGGEVGVGSARTPPSRERGAESHFRRGETNQLSSLLLLATTNTSPHPTIPARVGEPPIKGTSPHHPAPPAFLRIEYIGRKRSGLQLSKFTKLGDATAISKSETINHCTD